MKRLAVLFAALTVLGVTGSASAANGDNLRTIIADRTGTDCASVDPQGDHNSVGVGIAFDGTNLLISCYSDNTVTAVSPANGAQVAIHSITGAESLGALAWDNGRQLLWACSGFNTIGTIDLTTNVFMPAFTVNGCFDGVAYDASDDTLWSSPDATNDVTHSTVTGTTLGEFFPALPCGNSGIAVGGPLLYLATDGCSQIYTSDKAFATPPALFAEFPRRLEDLECDNVTFAPLGAIWSIDAYDNILNAWEIPAGTCLFGGGGNHGFMTGGGSAFTESGVRVTHGFELHCTPNDGANSLEVNWGKGKRFHLTSLDSASCSDDPGIEPNPPEASFDTYTGSGSGNYNGQPGATAEWTFTDAGEPGTADTLTLTIEDANSNVVLTVSGNLQNGNHQAHDG